MVDRKDLKRAGQVKINQMVKNALQVIGHEDDRRVLGSNFGRGLHNFSASGDEVEKVGGFRWTWRRMFDNSIFERYGIWFSDRLISGKSIPGRRIC